MAEYIEKAAALSIHEPPKSNRHYQTDNLDDAYGQGWDDALCSIEHIPAADVAPVVHGRWEMRPTGMATDTGPEYKAYCTVCNEPNKQYQPPFCPHCGAKMDGGEK